MKLLGHVWQLFRNIFRACSSDDFFVVFGWPNDPKSPVWESADVLKHSKYCTDLIFHVLGQRRL